MYHSNAQYHYEMSLSASYKTFLEFCYFINIATLAVLCLWFARYTFFDTFILLMFLYLKCVSYRQQIIGSCFLNSVWQSNNLCIFPPFINLFIYLFLAVLGLHCCGQAFFSCGERGLLFVVVHGLLIVVASLVVEHGLQARSLQ